MGLGPGAPESSPCVCVCVWGGQLRKALSAGTQPAACPEPMPGARKLQQRTGPGVGASRGQRCEPGSEGRNLRFLPGVRARPAREGGAMSCLGPHSGREDHPGGPLKLGTPRSVWSRRLGRTCAPGAQPSSGAPTVSSTPSGEHRTLCFFGVLLCPYFPHARPLSHFPLLESGHGTEEE